MNDPMDDSERAAYVRAALALQGYRFDAVRDAARVEEIVRQFARIETIAAPVLDAQLPLELESGSVFRP
jgi:DNA-binding response OmpR family regulator